MIIETQVKASRILLQQVQSGALSMEDRSIILSTQLAMDLANELIDVLPIEEKDDPTGEPGDTIVRLNLYIFTYREMRELWQVLEAPGACSPAVLARAKEVLFAL